jgi:hypothetical protein
LLLYKARLLKWPPFKILFVSSTLYISFMTLVTGRFCLITLEAFGFAGDTAYQERSMSVGRKGFEDPTISAFGLLWFGGRTDLGGLVRRGSLGSRRATR